MKVRAPGSTVRKPVPTVVTNVPTEAQTRELDRLMKEAFPKPLLAKWGRRSNVAVDADGEPIAGVEASVQEGTFLRARAVYRDAEIVKLGPMWASDVLRLLQHPWTPEMVKGLR